MKTETIDWDAWKGMEPPAGFADQVMVVVSAEARRSVFVPRRRGASRWMGALAAAALAAGSLTALAMWGPQIASLVEPPPPTKAALPAVPNPSSGPSRGSASGSPHQDPTLDVEGSGTHYARGTVVDRKLRETVRARLMVPLEAAGVERDPHTGLTIPAGTTGPSHNLSREYLQTRIREDFYPMAKGCYEEALAKAPTLAGTVVVDFMIVGDPKVGGIVDQAKINERTTIADARMTDCLRESMLSMVFAPPDNDGWVTGTYPFEFLPGNDDGR